MIEWSESQLMIRDAVRKFVEAEIKPRLEELEYGDTPPYDSTMFNGNKQAWENAIKTRQQNQNEYKREG